MAGITPKQTCFYLKTLSQFHRTHRDQKPRIKPTVGIWSPSVSSRDLTISGFGDYNSLSGYQLLS